MDTINKQGLRILDRPFVPSTPKDHECRHWRMVDDKNDGEGDERKVSIPDYRCVICEALWLPIQKPQPLTAPLETASVRPQVRKRSRIAQESHRE